MSFFGDLFGGANNAAQAQIQSQGQGLGVAQDWINSGNQTLANSITQGLVPAQQNLAQAQQGTQQYGNLLGLNGPAGSQNAQATLATMPGHQFALGQGANQVNAGAAASGMLNSGNQQLALQQQGQGLASQNYNNYAAQLQPYLGAQGQAAGQIGGLLQTQGVTANQNFQDLANLSYGAYTSQGNAQASADLANQKSDASLLGGIGSFISSALPFLPSDERLKEDIEPVGELFDGTRIYRYHYLWDDIPRIGVMAQEVERTNPDAVTDIDGFKAVHYGLATDYAASLGRMAEEPANDRGGATDYATEFSRFLEAA